MFAMAKIGRNAPCPCGSGKKYKKCCLEKDARQRSEALKAMSQEFVPYRREADERGDFFELPSVVDLDEWPEGEEEVGAADRPLDPELESLWGQIDDARRVASEDNWDEAIQKWWSILERVLPRIPEDVKAIESLERVLGAEWALSSLVRELDRGLAFAGRSDPQHFERRIVFCRDVFERFPESEPDFVVQLRRGIADSLFYLGRHEEGEREYQALREDHPDEAWVYIGWGNMYGLNRPNEASPQDLARAEELYRMGLREAADNHNWLRERLMDIRQIREGAERRPQSYLADTDIAELFASGPSVSESLWGRIIQRGSEVVPALNALMMDAIWIEDTAESSDEPEAEDHAWSLAHAAFLAARIGDPSSISGLLHVLEFCMDNDWLYDGLPWFSTRFGIAGIVPFLEFCMDPTRELYTRVGFVDGVIWAAGMHPEARPVVAAAFAEAIASGIHDAQDFTTWLMASGARIDDASVLEAIRFAASRDVFDVRMFGRLEKLLDGPKDWYLDDPPAHDTDETYRESLPGR